MEEQEVNQPNQSVPRETWLGIGMWATGSFIEMAGILKYESHLMYLNFAKVFTFGHEHFMQPPLPGPNKAMIGGAVTMLAGVATMFVGSQRAQQQTESSK